MSSAPEPARHAKLLSQLLLEDVNLRDVVEEFVASLELRAGELRQAHARLDWDLLAALAHRLKGAAGSYGYPSISRLCAELEQRFRAHQADGFQQLMHELDELTAAAQAGLEAQR